MGKNVEKIDFSKAVDLGAKKIFKYVFPQEFGFQTLYSEKGTGMNEVGMQLIMEVYYKIGDMLYRVDTVFLNSPHLVMIVDKPSWWDFRNTAKAEQA